jgi:hypothetical protein
MYGIFRRKIMDKTGDKNGLLIIIQNELTNIAADIMDKHGLSERDMYLVLQGVQLRISQMVITRMCYFDASQDEVMKKLIKKQEESKRHDAEGNSCEEDY